MSVNSVTFIVPDTSNQRDRKPPTRGTYAAHKCQCGQAFLHRHQLAKHRRTEDHYPDTERLNLTCTTKTISAHNGGRHRQHCTTHNINGPTAERWQTPKPPQCAELILDAINAGLTETLNP